MRLFRRQSQRESRRSSAIHRDRVALWGQLNKYGRRALNFDPAIDEFSALLRAAGNVWRSDIPKWASMCRGLHFAMETRLEHRALANSGMGPYHSELNRVSNALTGDHKFRSSVGEEAVRAIDLLVDGPRTSDALTETKTTMGDLQRVHQAFWNAALILLLERCVCVLEGQMGRLTLAPFSIPIEYHNKPSDEVWYEGWVDARAESSTYQSRILGFAVAYTTDLSGQCYNDPYILVSDSTLTVKIQVSGEAVTQTDGGVKQELVSAPFALKHLVNPLSSGSRGSGYGRSNDRPSTRPRYLVAGDSQAFRIVLYSAKSDGLESEMEVDNMAPTAVQLIGEHVVRRSDEPLGYAPTHKDSFSTDGFLAIFLRYRDAYGSAWVESPLHIPVEIRKGV